MVFTVCGTARIADFLKDESLRCFENRGAGILPAVARASCPRAGAGRSRDRGRDARATSVHFHGFRVPVGQRA